MITAECDVDHRDEHPDTWPEIFPLLLKGAMKQRAKRPRFIVPDRGLPKFSFFLRYASASGPIRSEPSFP